MKTILTFLLIPVLSLSQEHNSSFPTIEQLFSVKTVKVKKITSAKEQINYGYIVAEDSRKIDIHAWFSGYITKLFADTLYKKVEKGDALAHVYSPEVYKSKQDYLHSLEFNEKHPSPQMLQSAKTKLRLLGVHDEEIKRIDTKRKVDTFTTIYAPQSGWIFEKNINEGASFSPQKKLFQIVNLDKVWVEVKLYQDEIENLPLLTHFSVKAKGISKTYTAQKNLLYPELDPKEATATLRLQLDNDDMLLKPGMYAKVYASADTKSRLVIPRTAAIRKNGLWYAFLATEFKGEYEPMVIQVKPLDAKHYEIIKGLNEGDTLVDNALFMMDSDAQINGIY
ncbi:efflux RND transporter periplasmic adaptor subunit [Sulfurovum sp. XGS-02]|uniref:efflux RND transporter periplasmic adaptor subunit n=1 Tax=Sulfurovum sp. XGS-02 TaxID=2925411 RepID=UPI00205C9B13|nr:efflux RND transporter periplasmic adaptor subunit [Sulfurovum sp. XGS-02]UPT78374.1 efflux RND transporter periplasmic adaptor subunit [Sulfurovum sp. XGS-02]